MTTTELDTTIAGMQTAWSALEQAHAREVGALHKELAALVAQRWLVRPSVPLLWSPWIPRPGSTA